MKIFGWICIAIGILSLIGSASSGDSVVGPLFWLGVGIAMLCVANKKKNDEGNKKNN